MSFPRPCNQCGEKYKPTGPQSKLCNKCIKINFIKSNIQRYSRYKDCKTLKEALKKYGKN